MYSSSNSFLGGGNSGRPGAAQYGPSSFPSAPQPQQQPNGFTQQPIGFNSPQTRPQYTSHLAQASQQAFQAPQQQPQYTGYTPQIQQSVQTQIPPQPSFPKGLLPHSSITPQQTGQTSSQIAQLFHATPTATPSAPQSTSTISKIPKIRLSFLTAQDQAKFEQLFKSAVGDEQSLDGKEFESDT